MATVSDTCSSRGERLPCACRARPEEELLVRDRVGPGSLPCDRRAPLSKGLSFTPNGDELRWEGEVFFVACPEGRLRFVVLRPCDGRLDLAIRFASLLFLYFLNLWRAAGDRRRLVGVCAVIFVMDLPTTLIKKGRPYHVDPRRLWAF